MRVPWPRTWRGRLAVFVVIGAVLAVAIPYGILAFTTRRAPPPAHLEPTTITSSASSGSGGIDGSWVMASDGSSFVGYRIRERLGFFPAPNDAVGRTTEVQGRVVIGSHAIREARFTADLIWLVSDQPPRDQVNNDQGLETSKFPTATFVLTRPVSIGSPGLGKVVEFRAPGRLTLHGVSRPVVFQAEGRWDGDVVHVAGHTIVHRADYGIEIDSQYGLRIADDATIEAQLTFHRAGSATPTGSPSPSPLPSGGPPPATRATEPPATGSASLALTIPGEGQSSIYTVREDGTGLHRLGGTFGFGDDGAAWSPDGRLIAFSRGESRDPSPPLIRIFVMRSDGTKARAITTGSHALDTFPAWSPDGTRIAFVRDLSTTGQGKTEIFVVDADGTGLTRLTRDLSIAKDAPSWSPDGTHITYVAFGGPGNEDIWVMEADGSHARRLTSGPGYEYSPAWSPDGTRIAFARDGNVWVMHADGSHQRRLTSGPGRDGEVDWSPDGRQLVFTRDDRIIVMNPDGSGEHRVPLHGQAARAPSLRP